VEVQAGDAEKRAATSLECEDVESGDDSGVESEEEGLYESEEELHIGDNDSFGKDDTSCRYVRDVLERWKI